MAPGLHLNHLINWGDLGKLMIQYCDPGIEFPIGPCGLIHLTKKKFQLQVNNRKYLSDKVCKSPECKISGSKVFRKTSKQKVGFFSYSIFPWYHSRLGHIYDKRVLHFIDCFTKAVHQFADTERRKVKRVVDTSDRLNFIPKVVSKVKNDHPELISIDCLDHYWWKYHILCYLFPVLIEAGDSKTLLEFNDDEIRSVFFCMHGGQAVGNNWSFLYDYVFDVYLNTNLIVAFNLQNDPDQWGRMKPKSYFRGSLMYDCDGQTFLDSCRKYLKDEVYMKDFNAMKDMSKMCFKFIYFTEMLAKEIGLSWLNNHAPWRGYTELCYQFQSNDT